MTETGRELPELAIPKVVEAALEMGAALTISISGGKDSQALLRCLAALHRAREWPGPLIALHADLGRAEWKETPGHVEHLSNEAGVPLVVVRRRKGDLFARFEERAATVAESSVPWAPSAKQRYCTGNLKSGPLDTYLRTLQGTPVGPCSSDLRAHRLVICALGFRAQESRDRAARRVLSIRRSITSSHLRGEPLGEVLNHWRRFQGERRLAFDWNPLHRWSAKDIWHACGTSLEELTLRRRAYAGGFHRDALDGWPAHPAYVFGMERLSCALCVLASRNDLLVGARHNPEALDFIAGLEARTGRTFRPEGFLREILAAPRGRAGSRLHRRELSDSSQLNLLEAAL